MIANTDKHLTIQEGLKDYSDSLSQKTPAWFNDLRGRSLHRFMTVGIPTVKQEEWKYTNVAPIVKRKYQIAQAAQVDSWEIFQKYADKKDINIILVNGYFSPELSNLENLPEGVFITSLDAAFQNRGEELQALLQRYKADHSTAFVALNDALTHEGTFIRLDEKAFFDRVIHIIHLTHNTGQDVLTSPRTLISVGKSAEATILETHISFVESSVYFANALTDIFIEENGTLHYCKAQSESRQAFHIGTTRVWIERNANLDGFSLMVGGLITRNNLDIIVDGEGANATLHGLYAINDQQLADNHTTVDHREPNCTSNQLYKGILNGASHAVFNGKIFVKPIAQLTNSYQLNKNLMLGKNCQVDTKPQLEIFADDVKCTHGATIGQLNEDEIFYLRSRSIPKRKAIQILAHGFVEDILNTVSSESICKKLHILLEPTFRALD